MSNIDRFAGSVRRKLIINNEDIIELANKYILEGVLPAHKTDDAIHATTATIFEMDALISWNLKHLANFKRMEPINGINIKYVNKSYRLDARFFPKT